MPSEGTLNQDVELFETNENFLSTMLSIEKPSPSLYGSSF
jgi:hypothetical protein